MTLLTIIKESLKAFANQPLAEAATATDFRAAALDFFAVLGYASPRTLDTGGSPDAFLSTFASSSAGGVHATFNPAAALVSHWRSAHLLFQLTDTELSGENSLFKEGFERTRHDSYIFFAIELSGTSYTRTQLATITRQLNRLFPQPVMVLFKTGAAITLAVINRRANLRDSEKDVLGKVTLIRDINTLTPHRGHLDILASLAVPSLSSPMQSGHTPIRSFTALHAAWEELFNVELLRKTAYYAIANWFFWARENITPPPDAPLDADTKKPSLFLIRLLTRILFCWFLKERRLPNGRPLVHEELFSEKHIRHLLHDASPTATTYYTAILQNLFFATLNTEMDTPESPSNRRFARNSKDDHMVHTLWRHAEQLRSPDALAALLRTIPFLNGGLFECLDERVQQGNSNFTREIRADGFSSDPAKCPRIPNFLFFGPNQTADLSAATGNSSQTAVPVAPLLTILNHYVFTVAENTPLEEELALDPDLLGNIFENLLASYNPETGTVARNATGSFYTPDYVVTWMVEQALRPTLSAVLPKSKDTKHEAKLTALFSPDPEARPDFSKQETAALINAIDNLKILDPACGSGAFPMGALHKLTHILAKLDPENALWKQRQLDTASQIADTPAREAALAAIERAFAHDNGDYGRKLYLIENTLYGVDIQPLAVQIAKLRFFITLIVDQPIDPALPNYGILPLPNLETKIVAANTIIGLQRGQLLLGSEQVRKLEAQLKTIRHDYFTARSYPRKKALRKQDRELCKQLAAELAATGTMSTSDADRIARWNPYNTNTAADFFDPEWMFGLSEKFDLLIGNPPYVRQEELKPMTALDTEGNAQPLKTILEDQYETYAGTADLFVYFFERSLQLLKIGGFLSFITSNKYFRSAYGEKLRIYLAHATEPAAILDFGDTNIFTAIAYPAIFVTKKTKDVERKQLPKLRKGESEESFTKRHFKNPERPFPVFTWRLGPEKSTFPQVFDEQHNTLRQRNLNPSGWRLEDEYDIVLFERIKKAGTPLKEYCNGRIYYGIKTGFNEAFVVDEATKNALIAEHPSSKDVVKPYLRGRDVKRWRYDETGLWLLYIPWHFPLHLNRSIRGASKEAENEFKSKYPAVYRHLSKFKKELSARNKAETGVRYEWYALQRWGADYWTEFSTHKIIMGRFMDKPTYAFDDAHAYINNALHFIAEANKYIVSVLNSPVVWYYLRMTSPDLQGGFIQASVETQGGIPIPSATPDQQQHCETLATAIIALHKPANADFPNRLAVIALFEQWLNGLIYELFFPAELHARNLHLHTLSAPHLSGCSGAVNGDMSNATLSALHTLISDYKHPLRAALNDLQNLEEIQTIEAVDKK
ncbi:MAG TPA: Eco57I restriction-modification methylase domain-containing protein [Kiritimatiellia bacterium]|jgi:hypothetical protein|nr:MAG: Modification methylase PaeR7I [Verrucomicrobia bacterium ADurb.Bin018]HOD99751.1 Eco57I restriction-modification methylase domain-containing protein [Kiritimatiellia bacterium]HOR73813.1 Eco57I restriction-modification methylase domain-containing protein [Kiritimatiellia bacterium]HOU58153.1 Eco57I restriction-modification methylase domain-containing protein [Kiritimatiellia bacterium]HQM22433.1 Eco57I restriction-modification methylase domain-containing protein [Kiritimatiellia bacteri